MIAPTIIIGVGGIGSEICSRVSQQVLDKNQRKRIRFVCIDTDINDLNRRRDEDPRIITIQTSAPYMVSNYLDNNKNARENWFPVHNILMGKTPTEGAGQVRAISRLAFDEAVREGRLKALEKAIEELYFLDGAAAPQAVRVMIVSTLAGGTGSGIVLPVALHVRNFLQTRFKKNASVVRGFFLLPEIMYGNKSPEECGSLCCNAYASMRELDAFMRRGDGALEGAKYKDLCLKLPDPSSGEYVDYKVSPFNFCFLYDKRNTDDLQLKSFDDYKEHAANTIYAQTVSGMSNRSNSNEDNTIKPLVKSNGRNRFCGAGSSLLKYPRDSVLRYIAGQWCIENMSNEWLEIDKAYAAYIDEQKQLRKTNPTLKDMALWEYYIEQVDHGEKGSFQDMIRSMCNDIVEDEGKLRYVSKVDKFTRALMDYVKEEIQNSEEVQAAGMEYRSEYSELSRQLRLDGEKLDKDEKIPRDELKDKFEALGGCGITYISASKQVGSRIGRTVATQLFKDTKDHTEDRKEYRMEYYMKDEDDKFIHPNAARYFIYRLTKSFSDGLKALKDQKDQVDEELRIFDDYATAEEENAIDFVEAKIGKRKLFIPVDGKARLEFMAKINIQHEAANEYAMLLAQEEIFEAGLDFLRSLREAFELFYSNFTTYLKETASEVAEIERKYVNGEGKATRYVCASEKCLKSMLNDMPCTGERSSVNGKLSAKIYQEMKEYAMLGRKPNASIYFESLYQEKIIGFWIERVEKTHAVKINMDVISALGAEAEYEREEVLTNDQKMKYCEKILEQAERLAAPFVEEPMGEIRHPFTICAYNKELLGVADSTRASFIKSVLNDRMGGQQDDNVSPYELMMYKAIYNLSAGDLKRFRAPEREGEQGGSYYEAYIDTIRQISPDTSRNPVLTPHLDRKWHLTKFMPDLDDRNQKILENKVFSAFAWGMLTGMIEQKESARVEAKGHILYQPRTRKNSTFVVSNGTPCDELYEVVDALAINPPQVDLILKNMSDTIEREKKDRVELFESRLMNALNWRNIKEAFGDDYIENTEVSNSSRKLRIRQFAPEIEASIFDLIFWVKNSTPIDEYDEEDSLLLLDGIVRTIEDYVRHYKSEEETHARCYSLLIDQYELFLDNLKNSSIKRPRHKLEDACVSMIRDYLYDKFCYEYSMRDEKCDYINMVYDSALDSDFKND